VQHISGACLSKEGTLLVKQEEPIVFELVCFMSDDTGLSLYDLDDLLLFWNCEGFSLFCFAVVTYCYMDQTLF
jgi:hypothetical protein